MSTSDPVASYLQTFEELRARKRWSTQSVTFRFVALSLGAAASAIGYDRLEEVATDLRKRARWSSPLKSEIRYVVAATAGAHLSPLAHRAPVADQCQRSAGRGAACLPRRAGRRTGRGRGAGLHAPARRRLHPRPAAPARLAAFGRRPARSRRRGGPVLRCRRASEERGGTGRTEPLRRGGAAGADPRPAADVVEALQSIRAILDAQQAAMIAGIAAGAAVAGASAGAH